MPKKPSKPLISLGSPTGRSYLNFRISRRFAMRSALFLSALAILVGGSSMLVPKVLGTADGAIGSVYDLPPGPWGQLSAQPILLEAPQSRLSPAFRLGDGRWYFAAKDKAEVKRIVLEAGLTAEQSAALLQTLQPVPDRPELMAVVPSTQLIRELSPGIRSSLYEILAQLPENLAQSEPFRTTDLYLDDWLDAKELPAGLIAQVRSLLWRRGNSVLFSDYNTVADSMTSPSDKLKLLGQLTRKSSLLIKLRVPSQGDVEPLVEYWGTQGRRDRVRPILAAIARSEGGDLDISNLLPLFARMRLYRFPDPLPGSDLGPACHWTTFNFFNLGTPDDAFHNVEGIEKTLRENYVVATGEPRFGDIVLLTLPDGSSIHSAVHIADGIVFTKNGPSLATPFVFSTVQEMLAFYPNSQSIRLTYYRRAGN
jgi:hypothetical protein